MIQRLFSIALLLFVSSAQAQFLSDGLRLSTLGVFTGTRGMAMGGAMVAGVNDNSALAWNPAALAPIKSHELSFGLFHRTHESQSTFLGNPMEGSNTGLGIASIGLVSPQKTKRGHLTYALSLDRMRDYTSSYTFSAVNSGSSLLNTRGFLQDDGARGRTYDDYLKYLDDNNVAWALYLTEDLDSTMVLKSRYPSGLEQSGSVYEDGGLYAVRAGAGIDIAENIAVGATLSGLFGGYDYRRTYIEQDIAGLYPGDDITGDFEYAQFIDTRSQFQSGVNLKLGLYAYPGETFRFGFTVETPTYFRIHDEFLRTGKAVFANDTYHTSDRDGLEITTVNEYSLTTPMKLSTGAAVTTGGFTLATAMNYSDMSSMRFSDAEADLGDLNDDARATLGAAIGYNLGAEYIIKPWGMGLRTGYAFEPSPYQADPSSFDSKIITGGISLLLSKSILLEAAYRNVRFQTDHTLYQDRTPSGASVRADVLDDQAQRHEAQLSMSYRF